MAVLDEFEVSIEVARENLREYNDEELDTAAAQSPIPTIMRYIEARSGQKFRLHMQLHPGYQFDRGVNSLEWRTFIDGKPVSSRITLSERYLDNVEYASTWVYGKRTRCGEQWAQHPFVFWDLDITQDSVKGDHKTTKDRYGSLGTIEVQVFRFYTWGTRESSSRDSYAPAPTKSVSEKALKGRAVTLGAGCGDATPCGQPTEYSGSPVDQQPIVKFVFHYRTKKSLQDLLVVPKDDIENMTAEELRPLLRQQRVEREIEIKKENKTKAKREFSAKDLDDDILEIREVKRPKITATEVIEIDSD